MDFSDAWLQASRVLHVLRMFARYLPVDWAYAGKTGADDHLRNDVGIITAPDGRRWVIAAFCHDLPQPNYTVDNPGWLALARLAQGVVQSAK